MVVHIDLHWALYRGIIESDPCHGKGHNIAGQDQTPVPGPVSYGRNRSAGPWWHGPVRRRHEGPVGPYGSVRRHERPVGHGPVRRHERPVGHGPVRRHEGPVGSYGSVRRRHHGSVGHRNGRSVRLDLRIIVGAAVLVRVRKRNYRIIFL